MVVLRGTPVDEALDGAATAIAAGGSDTPRLDAELLLAEALDVPRTRLHVDRDLEVRGAAVRRFQDLVRRRSIGREPIAYLLGRREFRFIELEVGPDVLVPRPETELLVEAGLELPVGARVLDLGTGSGAVALALADERPDLEVWGSDVSEPALAVARRNGERLGLPVSWLAADLLAGIDLELDAVLANPPYVASGELRDLEVARHEPRIALDGGADGLAVVRRLVAQLDGVAVVALELGAGQAPEVEALLRDAGYATTERRRDLAGIERVVVGRR